ncbi:BTB/POZ and MATH domain-containing protein 3-like isoform X1 [Syzygium oleosum]|uniref:BTB/POZ and MATH domain-containing protein 3-like isoform X1 n=1 Tax=Syzygium oleosum TaxID=219896 RepID=UPI0011D1E6FA|nr:BTB/POZ and MATH domain-containing protein 3-like isoform X1 [Syzygium oleosum]
MANPAFDDKQGAERMVSDAPPTHYVLKIQSYSLLSKNSVDKYESGVFQAGGYKWKMVLYPNGNKSKNVKEHVSLYLSMEETSSLPSGWEVRALVRFFLLDQDKDSYLTVQDAMRKEWRFHRMKLDCGFDQFLPLKTFNDVQNGYLMDDTCMFGTEVFVTREKSTGKGENVLMVKDAIGQKHGWKVDNFSKLDKEFSESKVFVAGNQKWKIRLYPDGKGNGLGGFVSLYLVLGDADTLPPGTKVYADFSLRIMDQLQGRHISGKANHWFSASTEESGWARFISHATFYYPNTGTLVKDTCAVEAEVTVLGVVNAL